MKGLYITSLLILLGFVSHGQNILLWHEKTPLQWADFLGKVDDKSQFDAEAFTSVNYSYKFDSAGKYSFKVQACFDRTASWVKQERTCESLLQHEQAHFRLSHLFAKKLTVAFESYEYTANFKEEILTIFRRFEIDYHQAQRLFDKETNHSLNSEKVKEWEDFITEELNSASGKTDPIKWTLQR